MEDSKLFNKLGTNEPSYFITEIRNAQKVVNQIATDKGFWEKDRNDAEMIALMHSELSEALEAIRHEGYELVSEHIPNYNRVAEEMADVVIRVLDFCEARNIDLGSAIVAKMEFNITRPYKHGKKF